MEANAKTIDGIMPFAQLTTLIRLFGNNTDSAYCINLSTISILFTSVRLYSYIDAIII